MREFEQALKRARSMLGGKQGEPAVAVESSSEQASDVSTPPSIAINPSPPDTDAYYAASPIGGFDPMSLPELTAGISQFRDRFGASSSEANNVDGAFRILRTQILTSMKDRGAQVLGITSSSPGAGKSVTSIHLAMACARRREQKVVLADFDFRRPSVAQYLDAQGFRSSIGYFKGEGSIYDYLSRNEAGNLFYFLTDRSTEMSAEYVAGGRMDDALDELRAIDDDIIIVADLPPVMGCDDTIGIVPKLDSILLVVAAGETGFEEVEKAVSQLPKEKIITTVLNKVEGAAAQYEYY